jgi:hypothetical protein
MYAAIEEYEASVDITIIKFGRIVLYTGFENELFSLCQNQLRRCIPTSLPQNRNGFIFQNVVFLLEY